MKIVVHILTILVLLASNGLLYLFLFRREALHKIIRGFFKERELLVLLIHFGVLVGATVATSSYYSQRYKTYDVAEFVLSLSLIGFMVLCLSALPYQFITRKYSIAVKVIGVLACLVMAFVSLAMIVGMSWGRVSW